MASNTSDELLIEILGQMRGLRQDVSFLRQSLKESSLMVRELWTDRTNLMAMLKTAMPNQVVFTTATTSSEKAGRTKIVIPLIVRSLIWSICRAQNFEPEETEDYVLDALSLLFRNKHSTRAQYSQWGTVLETLQGNRNKESLKSLIINFQNLKNLFDDDQSLYVEVQWAMDSIKRYHHFFFTVETFNSINRYQGINDNGIVLKRDTKPFEGDTPRLYDGKMSIYSSEFKKLMAKTDWIQNARVYFQLMRAAIKGDITSNGEEFRQPIPPGAFVKADIMKRKMNGNVDVVNSSGVIVKSMKVDLLDPSDDEQDDEIKDSGARAPKHNPNGVLNVPF